MANPENLANSFLPQVNHNPDVLSCLANLSNDEVFTPPNVANAMLDMLPQELFSNPEAKFLDPVCKSGVFLREITKRLMQGLETEFPDMQKCLDHILHNQVYGIAITELTSLLSRRTLYCAKYPNCPFSISHFDNITGNIRYKNIRHTWKNGKCVYCGASQTQYDREEGLETHAYEFIHTDNPQEIFGDMKFDVIIGNPPYQLSDGGNGVSAAPLFHKFVLQAKRLNPKFMTMIIPSRWYAGGKGLTDFRAEMINDSQIKVLYDFESSKDCFDNVNIAGGICYFLWQFGYNGLCNVINYHPTNPISIKRKLNEYQIFVRSNKAVTIINKVIKICRKFHNDFSCARNPFGFQTNYRGKENKEQGDIDLLTSAGWQYVSIGIVNKNKELIDKYKVLIGRLVPSNGELDVNPSDGFKVITDTKLIGPGQINTETYIDIGVFDTLKEAKNFENYIKLKFPRFLLRQSISSLNVSKECFRFVPHEDFTKPWTDAELYAKYNLSPEEIDFIESMIKPMDLPDDIDSEPQNA